MLLVKHREILHSTTLYKMVMPMSIRGRSLIKPLTPGTSAEISKTISGIAQILTGNIIDYSKTQTRTKVNSKTIIKHKTVGNRVSRTKTNYHTSIVHLPPRETQTWIITLIITDRRILIEIIRGGTIKGIAIPVIKVRTISNYGTRIAIMVIFNVLLERTQ